MEGQSELHPAEDLTCNEIWNNFSEHDCDPSKSPSKSVLDIQYKNDNAFKTLGTPELASQHKNEDGFGAHAHGPLNGFAAPLAYFPNTLAPQPSISVGIPVIKEQVEYFPAPLPQLYPAPEDAASVLLQMTNAASLVVDESGRGKDVVLGSPNGPPYLASTVPFQNGAHFDPTAAPLWSALAQESIPHSHPQQYEIFDSTSPLMVSERVENALGEATASEMPSQLLQERYPRPILVKTENGSNSRITYLSRDFIEWISSAAGVPYPLQSSLCITLEFYAEEALVDQKITHLFKAGKYGNLGGREWLINTLQLKKGDSEVYLTYLGRKMVVRSKEQHAQLAYRFKVEKAVVEESVAEKPVREYRERPRKAAPAALRRTLSSKMAVTGATLTHKSRRGRLPKLQLESVNGILSAESVFSSAKKQRLSGGSEGAVPIWQGPAAGQVPAMAASSGAVKGPVIECGCENYLV